MPAHSQDLEGAGALVIELCAGSVGGPAFARDVHEISDSEVGFPAMFVGLVTLSLLGLL
jgi:hypothetical protein